MDLFAYVGDRIRELRTNFGGPPGISQEKLAAEIGVTANTVSRWETATYHPSLEDLDKIARFFGVSILDFFPKSEHPKHAGINALLRAAEQLPASDIDELRRYAEFRRARHIVGAKRPRPGRKRSTSDEQA